MVTERVEVLSSGATRAALRAALEGLSRRATARVQQLERGAGGAPIELPDAPTAELAAAPAARCVQARRQPSAAEEGLFRACVRFTATFRALMLREGERGAHGVAPSAAPASAPGQLDSADGDSDGCGRVCAGRFLAAVDMLPLLLPLRPAALAPAPAPTTAASAADEAEGDAFQSVAFDDAVLDIELVRVACDALCVVCGPAGACGAERMGAVQALGCLACRLLGAFSRTPHQLGVFASARGAGAWDGSGGSEGDDDDESRAASAFCRGVAALHRALRTLLLCMHAGAADLSHRECVRAAEAAACSGQAAQWAAGSAADALGWFETLAISHDLLYTCLDAFDALSLGPLTSLRSHGACARAVPRAVRSLEPSVYLTCAVLPLCVLLADESAPTGERARAATALAHDTMQHAQPAVVQSTTIAERAQPDYITARWARAKAVRPGADAARLADALRQEWRCAQNGVPAGAHPPDFCLAGGHLSYWLGRLSRAIDDATAEELLEAEAELSAPTELSDDDDDDEASLSAWWSSDEAEECAS